MKKIIITLLFISTALLAKTLPVEYFAEKPQYDELRISPDGKHLAYLYREEDQSKMAIMNLETRKGVYSLVAPSNREFSYIWWLNNERVVVLNNVITGWLDGKNKFYEVVGVDINGKNRESYSFNNVVSELKSDPESFLISRRYNGENVSLFKFNYTTGIKSYIVDQPKAIGGGDAIIFYVSVDINDSPRSALEYDPQDKDNFDDDIYRLHVKNLSDEWEHLDFPSINKGDVTYSIAGMNSTNDVIYFTSDYDLENGGTLGFFSYDLKSKEITKLFRHDDVDAGNVIKAPNGAVIGISYDAGYKDYYYVEDPLVQEEISFHKSIRTSFKNQNISFKNYTQDNSKAILYVYSDKNPGDYYLFDRNSNEATYFFSKNPKIKPKEMSAVEPFILTARDGLKMYGQMTIPVNTELKNLPMVIFPHGGPYGAKDSWGWDDRAQLLASRGYLVIQLDFRGSGGYGQPFIEKGYSEWGMKMQDDLTDATLWAINQGYADKERICIHGVSYGGYATMQGIVREPDLYKCAIADAGIYDIDLQWKKADSFYGGYKKEKNHYLKQMLGDNYEELMLENSPASNVDKIKANILLVHGKQDVRVPIENAYVLEKNLKEAGKKYQTLYKNDGHGFLKKANRVELFNKMLKFLDKNIGKK